MIKLLFFAPVILGLTACGSEVDLVKSGTMEFNKTITVGEALDSWKSCKDKGWENFETDNGVQVVQFFCHHKVDDFMRKAKNLLPRDKITETDHLDVADNVQTFQFTLNKDDTFQIDNVQVKTTWEDGDSFEDSQYPVEQLQKAYNNTLNFDSTDLDQMGAVQISYFFSIIKSRAN